MKDFEYYDKAVNSVRPLSAIKLDVYKANGFDTTCFDSLKELEREKKRLNEIAIKTKQSQSERAQKVINEFKNDMFNELGIQDNPKRELLYQKAYEMGHSYGFSEVFSYACDLAELIKD